MKTAGIVGGIGPESTVDYYRRIVAGYLAQHPDGDYPCILINSINMKRMLDLVGENRLDELTRYLAAEIEKLSAAGADFAAMASNTPHIVFPGVRACVSVPMISIVEATCAHVAATECRRAALFGTKFTMKSGFYDHVFSVRNIEVVTPGEADQDYIHGKYMGELVRGVILDETRQGLLAIADRLRTEQGIEGLILGGTELPLILQGPDAAGIPLFDTTRIHVDSILDRLS